MKNLFLILLVVIASCRTSEGPEETLKSFYERLFESRGNYSDIEDFVISDDETSQFWENELETIKNKRFKKLKVNDKNCTNDTCHLTVDLIYQHGSDEVQVRKMVKLTKVEEYWMVESFLNLKTYMEIKSEVDVREKR